jgi:hypothetical protein
MGGMRNVCIISNLKKRDQSEDLHIDERIILKWILDKSVSGECGLDSSGSGSGPVVGSSEHGNELSGSIKGPGGGGLGRDFLTS